MKTQILTDILEVVSRVCEVNPEVIRSMTKTTDVVQARAIFVEVCTRGGVCKQDLATFLNRKNVDCIGCCTAAHEVYFKFSQLYRRLHKEVTEQVTSILQATHEQVTK